MRPGHSPVPNFALTFDDGPDPIWTPLVLGALAKAGARATFFVVAPRARRFPEPMGHV
jgi:peptidoglycan/xylan/chitin deacetylase (PgdA/CDA1 family)